MCQVCQVARWASSSVITRSPASASHSLETCVRGVGVGVSAARIMRSMPMVPSSCTACARQVARCSASDRGSCLASRVSRFARCASAIDSFAVGGRPCRAVNSSASSAWRSSMSDRRRDHRAHSAASTPEISRTGRLPPARGTSTNWTPSAFSEVGLERGVVGLRRGDDVLMQDRAVDREPLALPGLDLVRHRHMGVQIGIAGAGVAVEERRRDQAAGLDLAGAAGALAGEDRVGLQEVERVEDGGVVRHLDLLRDLGRCDGPQRRDRLRRREGEVEPGHRALLERTTEGDSGDRMAAVAEQVLHLLGRSRRRRTRCRRSRSARSRSSGRAPRPSRRSSRPAAVDPSSVESAAATWRVRYSYPDPAASFFNVIVTPHQGRNRAASGHPDSSVKEVCSEKEGGRKRGRGGEGEAG